MVVDNITTPLGDPVFGVAHTSAPGTSFEDILAAGTMTCFTITAEDLGTTRADVAAATKVKFVASTGLGDVNINGSVYQIIDAFGGSHFSVVFIPS